MNRLKLVSLIFAISLFPTFANAVELLDSLKMAYENNPELKAKQEELKSRDEQLPQAYSGWLPTITASGEYGRNKDEIRRQGRDVDTYYGDNSKQLTYNQSLFNSGETLFRTSRAENVILASREELRSTEQSILLNTITAHSDVVRTKEVLDLSKNNEKVLREQMESTKDRFQLGETTKTDVSQSEARYQRGISDRIRAQGELTAALANYIQITGVHENKLLRDPQNFRLPRALHKIPNSLDEAFSIAQEFNPRLKSSLYGVEIGKEDVNISLARLGPDVSLRANSIRGDTRVIGGSTDNKNDSISLNLSIPLYQSGSEYSRIRESKREVERRKLDKMNTLNQVREDIISSWEGVITTRATIISTDEAVKAATVALDGVKKEQEVGSRTILDVLDAEQELFVTKVNAVNARRNEVVALYNLLFHMGKLSASDLGVKTEYFDPEQNYKRVRFLPIGIN